MNENKFDPREYAKEKVASRPQIDLENRFVPPDAISDVDRAHDEFLAGYNARQKNVNALMQGMKL